MAEPQSSALITQHSLAILDELNHRALLTENQIIDKVCAALSDESAAVMLEIAEGMIGAGMDEGGVGRARRNLARRLWTIGTRAALERLEPLER